MPKIDFEKVPPSWLKVYNFYIGLDSDWKRELFLQNLKRDQQAYLYALLEKDKSLIAENPLEVKTEDEYSEIQEQPHQETVYSEDMIQSLPEGIFYQGNFDEDRELEIRGNRILQGDIYQDYKTVEYDELPTTLNKVSYYENQDSYSNPKKTSLFQKIKSILTLLLIISMVPASLLLFQRYEDKIKPVFAKNFYTDYKDWAKFVLNGEDQDPYADVDGDGIINLDEFYLGSDPLKKDQNNNNKLDGIDLLSNLNPVNNKNLSDEFISKDIVLYSLHKKYFPEISTVSKEKKTNSNSAWIYSNKKAEKHQIFINYNLSSDSFVGDQGRGFIHYSWTSLPSENNFSYMMGDVELGMARLNSGDTLHLNIGGEEAIYTVKSREKVDFLAQENFDFTHKKGQLNINYLYENQIWLIISEFEKKM